MAKGIIVGNASGASVRGVTLVVGLKGVHGQDEVDFLADNAFGADVAINAAIQALPVGGGSVLIREGTYLCENMVVINKSNVALEGVSCASIIKIKNQFDNYDWYLVNISKDCSNILINQLTLMGYSSTVSPGYGGDLLKLHENTCRIHIVNCTFKDTKGFCINVESGLIDEIFVIGCHFSNSRVSAIWSYCTIICIGNTFIKCDSGITVMSGYASISDNYFYNCGRGLQLIGGRSVVSSCIVKDCTRGVEINAEKGAIVSNSLVMRGTGQAANYSSSQHTMMITKGANIISNNMLLGKSYTQDLGTGPANVFSNNVI